MRGWDAFLTEQDKAHQAYLGARPRTEFGKNPVVLDEPESLPPQPIRVAAVIAAPPVPAICSSRRRAMRSLVTLSHQLLLI